MSEQPEDWITAHDYEHDLIAVMSTVRDLQDGHRKFPSVTTRHAGKLIVAAASLSELAKQANE